jgi:hypothetical protein
MKMKYNDFEQQWQALSDDLQSGRCPMTDAELDREVRQVLWSEDRRVESGERKVGSGSWKAWVAAACVAAVVLPLALRGAADDDGIRTVKVDGEQVLFACNTGCSPDGTIETLKTYLQ